MILSWLECQSYRPTWLPMPESVLCSGSNVLKNNLIKSSETRIIFCDVLVARKNWKTVFGVWKQASWCLIVEVFFIVV